MSPNLPSLFLCPLIPSLFICVYLNYFLYIILFYYIIFLTFPHFSAVESQPGFIPGRRRDSRQQTQVRMDRGRFCEYFAAVSLLQVFVSILYNFVVFLDIIGILSSDCGRRPSVHRKSERK